MLILATLIVLNICAAQCATDHNQEAFVKLYRSAVTCDLDGFKAIYQPLSPENQNWMRQNFLLSGKQNAEGRSALKFFIDYWYRNRPEIALEDDYAKEAFSLLFPVFQETFDRPNQEGGIPSIHMIVTSSEISLLRLWMDAKMDVDARNSDDKTALHLAIAMDNDEYVNLLVKAGANINACDVNGKNALIYALEKNSNLITILLQKVTVIEACRAIASVFNTYNNYAIQYLVNVVHVSLVRQELSQLLLTPSNENSAKFSMWSQRVRDFIAIWDDLLRHIFVSQTDTVVMVHVAGGRFDYRMVSTIGQLHQLVVSSGAAPSLREATSDACSGNIDGDMMTAIALIGSGILTPNQMGRIKVNHDESIGSPKFEVMPSDTPDECTTSDVACAGDSAAAACSVAPSSNAAAENRDSRSGESGITVAGGVTRDPAFPLGPCVDELRRMFDSLQLGASASSASACASTSSTSTCAGTSSAGACVTAAAAPVVRIMDLQVPRARVHSRVPGERSVPRWREEPMIRRSRSRSPIAQSRSPRELGHLSERHHQDEEACAASPSRSQGRASEGSTHAGTWLASRENNESARSPRAVRASRAANRRWEQMSSLRRTGRKDDAGGPS